jgi:hypothetical protein
MEYNISIEKKNARLNSIRTFGYLSLAITICMITFKGAIGVGDIATGFIFSLVIMYFLSSKLALEIVCNKKYDVFFKRFCFYLAFSILSCLLNFVIFGLLAD